MELKIAVLLIIRLLVATTDFARNRGAGWLHPTTASRLMSFAAPSGRPQFWFECAYCCRLGQTTI